MDGETLLRVIHAIIDDIPDICLSKFKMCGGYGQSQQGQDFYQGGFWRSMSETNSTDSAHNSTSSSRQRRSADYGYDGEYQGAYSVFVVFVMM